MNVNYMAIIQPMRIYPHEIQRILDVLETLLWPKDEIDQGVMYVITSFLRSKLEEYEKQQAEEFSSMCVGTWTCCEGEENNPGTETHTEVSVAADFPYATEEEKKEIKKNTAKKAAKKRKAK
jgi:hypothetical protein